MANINSYPEGRHASPYYTYQQAIELLKNTVTKDYIDEKLLFYIKTVNNIGPDENGNVNVQGGGGDATNCVKYDNSTTQTLTCDSDTKDADIQFTNQGYINSAGFDIRTKLNNYRLRLRPSTDFKFLKLQYQEGNDSTTRVAIPVEMAQKDALGNVINDTYATKAYVDNSLIVDENIELPLIDGSEVDL